MSVLTPQEINAIYLPPPVISSQDISVWGGWTPSTWAIAPPTSPQDVSSTDNPLPTFGATTSELDKYRVLFLIVGLVLGAMLLGKR